MSSECCSEFPCLDLREANRLCLFRLWISVMMRRREWPSRNWRPRGDHSSRNMKSQTQVSHTHNTFSFCTASLPIEESSFSYTLILSADSESSANRPPPPPRRKPRQNRNSPRGRPAHHEHHAGFHANYHANPHFQQDFMHRPPPDPYRPPFQGRGYPPYPQAPPPNMLIDPWHPCPYPGPMFYPPPPPPPPN